MISTRIVVFSISWALLWSAPWVYAEDLKFSEPTAAFQPAVIQELALQRQGLLGFSVQADPVSVPSIIAPDPVFIGK